MTNMDSLIANIDPAKKSPQKDELWLFIKESLQQIGEINSYYKQLHEWNTDEKSLIQKIEEAYNQIQQKYNELFSNNAAGISKSQELSTKIWEIEKYHEELLLGEGAIKSDIADSQELITEFYNFLFSNGENSNDAKTKTSIKDINEFYSKLKDPSGLEEEITKSYNWIIDKYSELFDSAEGEKSKIEQLEAQITGITSFNKKIDDEIAPAIKKEQDELKVLAVDIETKRREINALLSDATAKTLAEGYLESMGEYSVPKILKFKAIKETRWNIFYNVYVIFFNVFFRYAKTLFSYLVFMAPLAVIVYFFAQPDIMADLVKSVSTDTYKPTVQELIFLKALIWLPLLWISWFGQKSISQRKRLFEEYNHKFRVVQMYIMFTSNEKAYTLKQTKELEVALLDVIKNNPAVHLGKWETMIDRIFEKFQIEGLYEKWKEDVKKDVKDLLKP